MASYTHMGAEIAIQPSSAAAVILQPRLLSADLAAAYLGISARNLLDRVSKHALPAPVKIGGRVLWDRHVLDRYIDALVGFDPTVPEEETNEGW